MQRLYSVHGLMQAFVDDAALAGAAELDGQDDAIARAFRAVHGDGAGGPQIEIPDALARFSPDGATAPVLQRVTFLRSLGAMPDGDAVLCSFEDEGWDPGDCNTDAGLSRDARFVEVVVQHQVGYGLIQLAGVTQGSLALRAAAGFRRAMCNSVPLMVCNPAEATQVGADFTFAPGRQLVGKLNTVLEPANVGFVGDLQNVGIGEALARVSPVCTEDRSPVSTGVLDPVSEALNVRFDMYQGTFGVDDPNYAPAPSAATGWATCGNTSMASNTSIPMPRDDCFMTDAPGKTGPCANPLLGDGRWARAEYWQENHPTEALPATTIDGFNYIDAASPIGGWSRYQTYRYEVENSIPSQGQPFCSMSPRDLRRDYDRRLLYVAVVNCVGDASKLAGGAPVKAFAKIFLTEPVGHMAWSNRPQAGLTWPTIANDDIAFEFVDVMSPGEAIGRFRVHPVLYR
jgi:hypothetical protein